MLSTWPSVSASSTRPRPSQTIRSTPSVSRSRASICSLRQRRVAARVQQALLGRDQRALAVDGDRAALEDQVAPRRCAPPPGARARARRTPRRVVGGELLAPGVEAEVHARRGGRSPVTKIGPRVARPRVVERDRDDVDVPAHRGARLGLLRRVDGERDRLEGGDRVDDRGMLGLRVGEGSCHIVSRAGQQTIVRSCGAHSAGIRIPRLTSCAACACASAPLGARPRSGSASGSRPGPSP